MIRAISMFDIANDPSGKEILKSGNTEALKQYLFSLGLDIDSLEYREEICHHRPLSMKGNEQWFGVRYVSTERKDAEWLKSEYCTFENKVECCGDVSLQRELASMSKEGNIFESTVDKAKRGRKRKNPQL